MAPKTELGLLLDRLFLSGMTLKIRSRGVGSVQKGRDEADCEDHFQEEEGNEKDCPKNRPDEIKDWPMAAC